MSGPRVTSGNDFSLTLGDCLDPIDGMASLLPGSVDVCITDPPYSRDLYLSFRSNKGGRGSDGVESAAHAALASESIGAAEDIVAPAIREILRVCRRWIVIFHDAECGHLWRSALGERHVRAGVWVKPNGVPQISGDRPSQGCEFIEIAHGKRAGRMKWNGGGHSAVWICNAENSQSALRVDGHPCPKPIALMEDLVRDFSDPGETILDPFAGSGSTGVAAIALGRRFVGWERDPIYHDIATKRLASTRLLARGFVYNGKKDGRQGTLIADVAVASRERKPARGRGE